MAILRIHFRPSIASKYKIQWRLSTQSVYPTGNMVIIDRYPGIWNTKDITVDSNEKDYQFNITSICSEKEGGSIGGLVVAYGVAPAFTASYGGCLCPVITNLEITAE